MTINAETVIQSARPVSRLLKSMANERRLIVLCHLIEGEKSVNELVSLIGTSQSAMSQHLKRLRDDGLVTPRRSAQNIYYSVQGDEAQAIMQLLHDLICAGGCVPPQDVRPEGSGRQTV